MNWKRVWSGAAAAGFCVLIFQVAAARSSPLAFTRLGLPLVSLIVSALLDGFFCSVLYATARPRLGPGPKTAVVIGSAIYLIKYGLGPLGLFASGIFTVYTVLMLIGSWFAYVAATYLAGWQYIERAP